MNINNKNKNKKGFAMLFTVVIVSAVSVITAGLTNAIYKQIVLSSLAQDSQTAFYQADTASDCALYADLVTRSIHPGYFTNSTPTGQPWSCGNPDGSGINNLSIKSISDPNFLIHYTIETNETIASEGGPCFKIDVTKNNGGVDAGGYTIINVTVKATGYNICDLTNPRTVEREIETDYNQ